VKLARRTRHHDAIENQEEEKNQEQEKEEEQEEQGEQEEQEEQKQECRIIILNTITRATTTMHARIQ
jgi:FtsZ-interacting cell division protein ZipA